MIDREEIVSTLPPLEIGREILSPIIKEYWQFYGIDLADENVTQTIGLVESAPFQICCNVFQPKASIGTCFVVHGYFDHGGLYKHLIKHLVGLNFTVVMMDLPGHGLSSGERANIDSFFSYEKAFQSVLDTCAELPRPWHAAGQSTGCSVILLSIIQQPQNAIEKTVLFAPLIRPRGWYQAKFFHPILSLFKPSWPRYFTKNSHDKAFLDFLKNKDPMQAKILPFGWLKAMRQWVKWILRHKTITANMLVIQGGADFTVDGEFNVEALSKRVTNIQVSHHASGRHQLVNESTEIREQLFADMERFLLSAAK